MDGIMAPSMMNTTHTLFCIMIWADRWDVGSADGASSALQEQVCDVFKLCQQSVHVISVSLIEVNPFYAIKLIFCCHNILVICITRIEGLHWVFRELKKTWCFKGFGVWTSDRKVCWLIFVISESWKQKRYQTEICTILLILSSEFRYTFICDSLCSMIYRNAEYCFNVFICW